MHLPAVGLPSAWPPEEEAFLWVWHPGYGASGGVSGRARLGAIAQDDTGRTWYEEEQQRAGPVWGEAGQDAGLGLHSARRWRA